MCCCDYCLEVRSNTPPPRCRSAHAQTFLFLKKIYKFKLIKLITHPNEKPNVKPVKPTTGPAHTLARPCQQVQPSIWLSRNHENGREITTLNNAYGVLMFKHFQKPEPIGYRTGAADWVGFIWCRSTGLSEKLWSFFVALHKHIHWKVWFGNGTRVKYHPDRSYPISLVVIVKWKYCSK